MPDADDFDVEYFRKLLAGEKPAEAKAPPAARPRAAGPKPAAGAPGKRPAAGAKKAAAPRAKKRR
jgi:hypothetical protein